MPPLELALEIRPRARLDVIDIRARAAETFGAALSTYARCLYVSRHTTAGFLPQSLAARLPRRGLLSDAGRRDLGMALLLDDGEDDAIARFAPPEVLDDLPILRRRLDAAHPGWRTDDTAGIYETIEDVMRRAVRHPGEKRDRRRDSYH